jgi:DNA-binding PadR family transcriptional regulator
MTGTEIALELKKRRGKKPSPGTIYPVLKLMKKNKLLSTNKNKSYSLTEEGKKSLEQHLHTFMSTFHDFDEMKSCCYRKNSDRKNNFE